MREENTPFPAVSRSLETLSSGCRFPHAFLSFNVKPWQSISAPCQSCPLGWRALGNFLQQLRPHSAVGKGALLAQIRLHSRPAQGHLAAVKLCPWACLRFALFQLRPGEFVDLKDQSHQCCGGDLISWGKMHKDELRVKSVCSVYRSLLGQ